MPNLTDPGTPVKPGRHELRSTYTQHLGSSDSSWSIGTRGALAEFFRDETEAVSQAELERLRVTTRRGGIELGLHDSVQPLAYERVSRHRSRWTQGVLFCLPEKEARLTCRCVVTELGEDYNALRASDKSEFLFDLGLGIAHVEACIRTSEPSLLRTLRSKLHSPLLGADTYVLDALIDTSPHRVFISALGRIEVYQPIPRSVTPQGPHTHILPKLLNQPEKEGDRPIPSGHRACLELHPASGMFEALLGAWGAPRYVHEKRRVLTALEEGLGPEQYAPPRDKLARTAVRVAIRQFARAHEDNDLEAWRAAFDWPDDPS